MNSLSRRVAELDPKKRELLELLLKEQSVDVSRTLIVPQERYPDCLPLSFAQERLWFLDQLDPGNPSYNEPFAVRLNGPLNVAVLEGSINEILRRHEALRTSFSSVEGRPAQVISPSVTLTLPAVDLRDLPEAERETKIHTVLTQEAQRPFDLTQSPLLRFLLLRLDNEDHVLQLTVHHIVSDAWSIQLLVREMAALYGAFSAAKPSPLADLSIQYPDFALWQRQWLQGEVLEEQLSYWRKQLGGRLPILELPTDHSRPAEQTFHGAKLSFALPAHVSHGLKALSRREGTTLFVTLLTTFQVLLQRYTAQEDIVVGSPIANRNRAEINELIGFFSNILPLRINLSGNPSFLELLFRVREAVLEAYAHQDIPFAKLVEALQPERDPSHTALFQVAFELQDAPMQPLELPGLRLAAVEVHGGTAKFDLALHTEDTGQGLNGSFEYNTDLFDTSTIERMLGHWQSLLEAIASNADQSIRDLPLLTDVESHQLLVEWNDTRGPFPDDQCIHHIFQQQARQRPEAIAVTFGDQRLGYEQLNNRANQLGHYLRARGVGPEVVVGICLERGIDVVVAVLGVLKAGAAYLPLDPAYPLSRLAFMLEDAQVAVLLTQEGLIERLPAHWGQVISIDGQWEQISEESREDVESGVDAQNLAYVIYTSGSTGTPKGVMVEHRGLCNLASAQFSVFGVQPNDNVLQFASLSFDASIFEIIMALLSGATLFLGPQESLLPGPALIRLLSDSAISNVTIPPSVLAALPAEELPNLKTIIVAGEPCPAELVARWSGGHRFFNAYGPTEATVWATVAQCTDGRRKPSIGRAIANTRVYLLDSDLRPVPIGVPGELHIAGVGLARGYLNRPEVAAEKFKPNPFSQEPGARLYKTDDLARYLPDGSIDFLGRIDHQVKIRGFRIELGEVEAVLGQHPGVREAVVIVREGTPGQKRLVAYAVPDSEPLTIKELSSFLRERLPVYMVPSDFVFLSALPLTRNGKVDRQALPEPARLHLEMGESFVPPYTDMERAIATVWQEVLEVDKVGVHNNFFDLGGHSLLMVQAHSKLQELFKRDIAMIELFKYTTINSLARFLAQRESKEPGVKENDDLVQKLSEGKHRVKKLFTQASK